MKLTRRSALISTAVSTITSLAGCAAPGQKPSSEIQSSDTNQKSDKNMADTTLSARVWPEDTGTGVADGNEDWDSAGYIGGMHAQDNNSDYVEAGLEITPDYTTPAFDLAAGLAYIKYTGSVDIQLPSDDSDTYSGTWDQGVTFAVDVDAQTGITLTGSAVNRIYLATDLSTNDGAYVRVDTEASPNVPTDPYIKIAEVDTSSDTTSELNREPDASFGDVSVTGEIDAASANVDGLSNRSVDKPLIYLESGVHEVSDTLVVDGVAVIGAGDTTIRSVSDTANDETIELRNGAELHNLTIDTNLQNRPVDVEYGVDIRDQSGARVVGCDLVNFGHVSEEDGAGVWIGFGSDGEGSVSDVAVRDCTFEPVNWSAFGVRARSDYTGTETTRDDYTDSVTGVRVENCTFRNGTWKNCVEFVGPVTRDCHMVNCTAIGTETNQAVFAINYGPEDCSANVRIEDCSHINSTNRAEAFRLMGAEGWDCYDCDVTVTVDGYHHESTQGNRGVYVTDVFDCRVTPRVEDISTTDGPLAGVSVSADGTTINNAYINSPDRGIDVFDCTDANIINTNINATNDDVLEIGTDTIRPRWDGVIRGGPLGGQDLTTITGQYVGDKAMSDGTNTTAYLEAVWTGSAWQPSDGGATI